MKKNINSFRAGWLLIAGMFAFSALSLSACSSSSDDNNKGDTDADVEEAAEAEEAIDAQEQTDTTETTEIEETAEAEETVKDAIVGAFQVLLVAPIAATSTQEAQDGYTTLSGKVYDGPTPANVVWELKLEEGYCKLLTPRVPFCGVSCGAGVCVEDDTCMNYPTAQSAGAVTVKGLKTSEGATEFVLNPIANGYQSATLPYPAFDEGGDITVAAAGTGTVAAFSLAVKGVAPLELTSSSMKLAKDTALSVTWKTPAVSDIDKIYIKLDISHHGGSKGKIECEAPDTGSIEIASVLINKLLALGAAGFPTIVVDRKSLTSTSIAAGKVQLSVVSEVEAAVEVPGVVSCNEDTDCPQGQTCQKDLQCK